MKKPKTESSDELRREYKRADFGEMIRGKYAQRLTKATNIVILDPEVAMAFPNDKAVNDTLRSLLNLAKASAQLRSSRTAQKRRAIGFRR